MCNLSQLNQEYIALLNARRHEANPRAPIACFDINLLFGCWLHNATMQRKDSLYHAAGTLWELCGTLYNAEKYRNNPKLLAKYIITQLATSPPHAAIQIDGYLKFVTVTASKTYFVVRLSNEPTSLDKRERNEFIQALKQD